MGPELLQLPGRETSLTMNRREFLQASVLSVAAAAAAENQVLGNTPTPAPDPQARVHDDEVNFGYAFAPPHRMTVARPEASEKTLLDLEAGVLTMSWSYDDLRNTPLAIFKTPRTGWRIKIRPLLDGKPLLQNTWSRGEEFLPILKSKYFEPAGSVQLEVIGGATAALARVKVQNSDSVAHRFSVACEAVDGWVMHNPSWVEPGKDPDALVAGQAERPDRLLLFGIGASKFPDDRTTMTLEWVLQPGEMRNGWIIRPYLSYQEDLPRLRQKDWSEEFESATKEWQSLLGRAVSIQIPDSAVRNAFYACLGDLFIMREPLAAGYMGTLCGTEGYRSTNPFEPSLAVIALDQAGFHDEAANGLRVHLDMQEANGNWSDPKGWAHHMWGASGMKAWASTEHFKLTGDQSYLRAVFPRLAASSRWQETQRQKTRIAESANPPATYGLMPRGMGDGGLMNGSDYFGVFYTHNVLAVFADQLAVQSAETLGEADQLVELRKIHDAGLRDLRASLRAGAIRQDDYQWIPGSPANPTGSRWGALYTLFPTGILEPDDPLVVGTLKKIEQSISPGGQPVHTGWMEDGAWVAITLDNVAEAHLVRGDGDTAIAYLYSTLNHGTPLFTWCEERGQEPQTKKTSGDRQHLWTPLAVVRFLRDCLVMERPDSLHLGLATARSWLRQGAMVGIREAPTHFGNVSYQIQSDVDKGVIRAEIAPPAREPWKEIVLHLRHPQYKKMRQVTVNGISHSFESQNELVRIASARAAVHVEAFY
jgi:hypothetical protein